MMLVLVAMFGAVTAAYVWYGRHLRRRTTERLAASSGARESGESRKESRRTIRAFPPRRRFLVPITGVAAGALLWLGAGLPLEVAAAGGLLIAVLARLLDDFESGRQSTIIEQQLAAAIYIMVGSLRAGASLLAAFDSALQEVKPPLRPYFQEVAGRIRLGDDPRTAVGDLQASVPLETFRLFATSLVVHWEVGGSLATTLSTVGQTVRDRIELSRRVRAQGVEAHASVAVVLGIAYILGYLMWRSNPGRMEAFVSTGAGTMIVAGVIMLQAVGLIWMSRISRSSY